MIELALTVGMTILLVWVGKHLISLHRNRRERLKHHREAFAAAASSIIADPESAEEDILAVRHCVTRIDSPAFFWLLWTALIRLNARDSVDTRMPTASSISDQRSRMLLQFYLTVMYRMPVFSTMALLSFLQFFDPDPDKISSETARLDQVLQSKHPQRLNLSHV